MTLSVGLAATLDFRVTPDFLASSLGNTIPVLATPILLWYAELACMKAVENHLPEGRITAGLDHAVSHTAPTPEGHRVVVEALLTSIDGRRLTFRVDGRDEVEPVLSGTHVRAVMTQRLLLKRVDDKTL